MNVAIIGGGWAGMAAAVQATQDGLHATVFEASRTLGGRARGLDGALPDGTPIRLDNGQHILIGAYVETLRLMRLVGVDPERAFARLPLALSFADGSGLALRHGRAPWDALAGIATARGWRWRDRLALLRSAIGWRLGGFQCPASTTVTELCAALPAQLRGEFIETDFAAFLTWRESGFPAANACNGFAMAALRGADGAFLLGEMAAHTASAGAIYFPAGSPDRQGDDGGEGRR